MGNREESNRGENGRGRIWAGGPYERRRGKDFKNGHYSHVGSRLGRSVGGGATSKKKRQYEKNFSVGNKKFSGGPEGRGGGMLGSGACVAGDGREGGMTAGALLTR